MNEILVVNKQENMTSRDVVNKICKKFGTKKVGHTGTLDPIATGVLIILIGKYTSLVEVITSLDKTYEAEIELGVLTDTLDITGNILKEEKVNKTKEEIEEAIISMLGTYTQEVPIYSAVKVNGKKLYEYARNNESVELPKHEVTIKSIELISEITNENNHQIFKIRTNVSKGTYIRALINDIAKKLGTYGTMKSLNRIKQGNFDINESYTLDEIMNDEFKFYDINKYFDEQIEVDDETYFKIKNGVALPNPLNKKMEVYKYNGQIIAIYKKDENMLKMWKYLI